MGLLEPEVRPECAVCGEERRPETAGPYREHAHLDPFCSSLCCQSYYGVTTLTIGQRKAQAVNAEPLASVYSAATCHATRDAEHTERAA